MYKDREKIAAAKRWVVKIGSALLTDDGYGLKHDLLNSWVKQIAELNDHNIEFVIVSSGAVAEGVTRLGWNKRPEVIHELQAAAAVGQMGLIQAYAGSFKQYAKKTAQILLTHDDIADRSRYLNARTSLNSLIKLGVIPVVNENDTVATDEIRFGDNDTLAGLVANLIDADLLVLLTDQKGLFTADPRKHETAELITHAAVDAPELDAYAGEGGRLGLGGMRTKLKAASIAARSGTNTVIASGLDESILIRIADGEEVGTWLTVKEEAVRARKQWLANQNLRGSVTLDRGAVKAVVENGTSLLPVGICSVAGEFKRGEIIACLDSRGKEIARGLTNYDAEQARLIMGKSSAEIKRVLGQPDEDELIHRDNLTLT